MQEEIQQDAVRVAEMASLPNGTVRLVHAAGGRLGHLYDGPLTPEVREIILQGGSAVMIFLSTDLYADMGTYLGPSWLH
jgi:hypothetical protein